MSITGVQIVDPVLEVGGAEALGSQLLNMEILVVEELEVEVADSEFLEVPVEELTYR